MLQVSSHPTRSLSWFKQALVDDAVPVARRQYAVHGSGRPLAVLVSFLQNLADGSVQTAASYVKLMKQVCGLLRRCLLTTLHVC